MESGILQLLPEQVESLKAEVTELNQQYLKLIEEQKQDQISVSDKFHTGYDLCQQKLATIRDRVKTIDEYLRDYELIEGYDSEKISIGTQFTVYMDFGNNDGEKGTYKLIHTSVSASETKNYVSLECPLGEAVINKRVGEPISYLTPAKKVVNGVILDILLEKQIETPKEKVVK